ncbi:MAG: hypothetical protein EZS28_002657 [Streblomastix strix]|uniref:Uncharacterized protein n=1 Tax=Streblomastix strix TaxID=222440 RepID=A0A5J4X3H6_9EUKA|nr:MAG: hypothetical protein EZS28_002657 [Streblomastix strix]
MNNGSSISKKSENSSKNIGGQNAISPSLEQDDESDKFFDELLLEDQTNEQTQSASQHGSSTGNGNSGQIQTNGEDAAPIRRPSDRKRKH